MICGACSSPVEGPRCPRCARLVELPMALAEDPYLLLGLPRSPHVDEDELRKRFYAMTAETHPDRVAQEDDAHAPLRGARWTEAATRAYRVLRDRDERVRWLLLRALGGEADRGTSVPVDLVESYFALEELDPKSDAFRTEARALASELEAHAAAHEESWKKLVATWTGTPADATQLREWYHRHRYMTSMREHLAQKEERS